MTTYLVTGASGQLGRLTIERLAERVDPASIIALVRSDAAAADYASRGIAVRRGDYDDRASLVSAFEGVDRLLFISSSAVGHRLAQHENVVAAAQAAAVGFIAYTSLLNPAASAMKIGQEHVATEEMLTTSGIPHTLLRVGWYLENFLMDVPSALESGRLFGASGSGRFSAAMRADYAEAAAIILQGGHDGETLELAGDVSFDKSELAAILSELSGKAVTFVNLPEPALAAGLAGAGIPGPIAEILADADAKAAHDLLRAEDRTLSLLIARPTIPLRDVLAAALSDDSRGHPSPQ